MSNPFPPIDFAAMSSLDPEKPFLNCYIWELNQWPRHGFLYNYFSLRRVFFYNSSKDETFEFEASSGPLQVPEFLISNLGEVTSQPELVGPGKAMRIREFIVAHAEVIARHGYPIVKRVETAGGKVEWICDLNMIFYRPKLNWRAGE